MVAMPHARLGETPCAFVVLNEGYTFDLVEMKTCLDKAGLARQKFPERIIVVPELPKTAAGKVLKHVLREKAKAYAVE